MISISMTNEKGWLAVSGISPTHIILLQQKLTSTDLRNYQTNLWYFRTKHLMYVTRFCFSLDEKTDISGLPKKIQKILLKAKENWDLEDSRFRNRFRQGKQGVKKTPKTKAEYYHTLFLIEDAPSDIVDVVWRFLARTHHPDKGGDEELFKKYQAAYSAISGSE